jgi:hypothetical protein
MLLTELFENALPRNGTIENGLAKMTAGYLHGKTATENTCYAHVGSELARLKPQDATIRFWGLKSRGLVVHGDAILGDGTVISDSPPEDYARKGYELVSTLPLATFLAHVARVG